MNLLTTFILSKASSDFTIFQHLRDAQADIKELRTALAALEHSHQSNNEQREQQERGSTQRLDSLELELNTLKVRYGDLKHRVHYSDTYSIL